MHQEAETTTTATSVALIGTGPAALMAADVLASAGIKVRLFEKRSGPAWKLYVAGSSGLNISNCLPLDLFAAEYSGPATFWSACLDAFPPAKWLEFIEQTLGLGTFLGTSGRYFVETMHAAKLIRQWKKRLEAMGAEFFLQHECQDFTSVEGRWRLDFAKQDSQLCDAVIFALGGASYETDALSWPQMFRSKGIGLQPFTPANTGYEVNWQPAFRQEVSGLPLKNISLRTSKGEKKGDLVVTDYGLEGTPIYFLGTPGRAFLDLKPDLSYEALLLRLQKGKENLAPLRRAQKFLQLSPAANALLFHHAPAESRQDPASLARCVKEFPLELTQARPLAESISSSGGVHWQDLDEALMLKTCPGVYLAGEMIDWEAPTGGFLIQACISQGHWVAKRLLMHLQKPR